MHVFVFVYKKVVFQRNGKTRLEGTFFNPFVFERDVEKKKKYVSFLISLTKKDIHRIYIIQNKNNFCQNMHQLFFTIITAILIYRIQEWFYN